MLKPLEYKDLEEKVQENLKRGYTIKKLRDTLEHELFEQRRITIRSLIQEANLTEQVAYIDKKIKGEI